MQSGKLKYINYCSGTIPIVVLHGLKSSSEKMLPLCEWLGDTFSKKVINIEIGNGEKTSLYTPLPDQLDELCDTIYKTKV